MIGGVLVRAVPAGTVIRDDATGEELTVTETSAVFRGAEVFVTVGQYEALKAHPDVKCEGGNDR